MPERAISTGSLRLDTTLGIGGIPRGEFIEISGTISSGKTTLCQHIIAEAQKTGEECAWLDTDHSFDPTYALRCGVSANHLYISEPDEAEQALQMLEVLAGSGSLAVVVLDSVANLISQDEMKLVLGEPPPVFNDRLLSQTLRRLYKVIHKNKTTVIFTSQIKSDISSVYHNLALNPARLALKLQAGLRLELHSLHPVQINEEIVENCIRVRIIKNRFAPCFRRTGFDIMYNNGINKSGEIFDLGTQLRIICKQKTEYFFKGQNLGTKRVEVLIFLEQNLSIAEEIELMIRQRMLPDFFPAAT